MARQKSDSLTEIQTAILQVITQSKAERGIVPSMREIADAVELGSTASVSYQLDNLETKGYIRRQDNLSRNIEVLISPEGWDAPTADGNIAAMSATTMVPWVGQIAAGIPITADQNVEEVMALPRTLVGQGELFMLKVVGESMIDAAICDGDWVVVRRQQTADNGDIVAAQIDGEATVKTFKNRDGQIWLLNLGVRPLDRPALLLQDRFRRLDIRALRYASSNAFSKPDRHGYMAQAPSHLCLGVAAIQPPLI